MAIAPSKKFFGVAVSSGAELTHFSVRRLPNETSKKLLKDVIPSLTHELIALFSPQVIVVRAASQYQKTSTILRSAIEIIRQEAAVCKLKFTEVSLAEVKLALCDDQRATQKKAFQNLIALHPELRQFADRPNKWQNDYYHNLFSAVSVGVVFLRSLSKSK